MKHKKYLTYRAYFALVTYGFCLTITEPALGSIKAYFDITSSQTGLLFSFQSLGLIPTVLLGGVLADRYRIKVVSF